MGSLKVVVSHRPCFFFFLVILPTVCQKKLKLHCLRIIFAYGLQEPPKKKLVLETRAGARNNYERKYKLNIKIEQEEVPLERNPIFLEIKLDPKLAYTAHLQNVITKQAPKLNLIRKIKSFKWSSSLRINLTLYKTLICSLFDYCFIILNSGTEKIKLKLQNRILGGFRSA